MWTSARIVFGCVGLACALGLALDLVTAHVAVEYFTVHHPKVIDSREPLAMAFIWGIGASWWFGLIAGAILAYVNSRLVRPLSAGRVLLAVGRACIVLWILMMLVLVAIYAVGGLAPEKMRGPTFESDRRLMSVAVTHMTEYVMGAIALIVVALRIRGISKLDDADG